VIHRLPFLAIVTGVITVRSVLKGRVPGADLSGRATLVVALLFSNLKGGVAKTTNAVAVAECLAYFGKPTLLIDADHQCTASEVLLGESRALSLDRSRRTFHDLLLQMLRPGFEQTQFVGYVADNASNIDGGLENLHVIPCSVRIDDFQSNYAKGRHRVRTSDEFDFQRRFKPHGTQFRKWLRRNFAFTIVDCPPSLAVGTILN
jgi:chromosome partitioning protein